MFKNVWNFYFFTGTFTFFINIYMMSFKIITVDYNTFISVVICIIIYLYTMYGVNTTKYEVTFLKHNSIIYTIIYIVTFVHEKSHWQT